jgi:hypothetical protein
MLKLGLTLMFGALVLFEGCTKKAPAAQLFQTPPPASSPTVNVLPRLDASLAQAPAPPSPLRPLAGGKRVRITKLDVPPIEITVPPDFKLRMEGDGGEVRLVAHIEGPAFNIEVQQPEGGFSTLSLEEDKRQIAEISPKATFPHASEWRVGSLLVVRNISVTGEPEYAVSLLRKDLRVSCTAGKLETLQDAESVASVCLTLRAVPGKTSRR